METARGAWVPTAGLTNFGQKCQPLDSAVHQRAPPSFGRCRRRPKDEEAPRGRRAVVGAAGAGRRPGAATGAAGGWATHGS